MHVLFDECVPRPLKKHLVGHDVRTVQSMGWASKDNGELLQLVVTADFDVFLTVDQNLSYQQDLRKANIAVVVLIATTNRMPELLPLVPSVLNALATIQP